MTDVDPGPGWWQAEDGGWHPPPPHANQPQLPSLSAPPDQPSSPGDEKKSRTSLMVALVAIVAIVVVGVIAVIALSKKSGPSTLSTSAPPVANTAPSSALAESASRAWLAAFNSLDTVSNTDSAKLNSDMQSVSPNPAAASALLNSWIASDQSFDSTVGAIRFPSSDQSNVQQVLASDAALESGLEQLGANTDNISNYNAALATLTPLKATFVANCRVLGVALGLTTATTAP